MKCIGPLVLPPSFYPPPRSFFLQLPLECCCQNFLHHPVPMPPCPTRLPSALVKKSLLSTRVYRPETVNFFDNFAKPPNKSMHLSCVACSLPVNEKSKNRRGMPMRQWGVAGNSGRVFGAGRWQSGYTLIYDGTAPAEGFLIEFPSGTQQLHSNG